MRPQKQRRINKSDVFYFSSTISGLSDSTLHNKLEPGGLQVILESSKLQLFCDFYFHFFELYLVILNPSFKKKNEKTSVKCHQKSSH